MSLSTLRAQTTKRLAGIELPDAFVSATTAAYARLLTKPGKRRSPADKRDVRRLARQEARIVSSGVTP